MEKHLHVQQAIILLIDDHPITSELIFDVFQYLNCKIIHVDSVEKLTQLKWDKQFDLILINQAVSFQHKCSPFFGLDITVICYTPDKLIDDFRRASYKAGKDTLDKGWIIGSELYQFLRKFI